MYVTVCMCMCVYTVYATGHVSKEKTQSNFLQQHMKAWDMGKGKENLQGTIAVCVKFLP